MKLSLTRDLLRLTNNNSLVAKLTRCTRRLDSSVVRKIFLCQLIAGFFVKVCVTSFDGRLVPVLQKRKSKNPKLQAAGGVVVHATFAARVLNARF